LQKYIEDPLSEALIQGTLPRPSELEVYLGDGGIYCRPLQPVEQPALVSGDTAAPEEMPTPVTPLFMFE
jgi:ATP-dependent Clp protease ATP-binding subunit ClpC